MQDKALHKLVIWAVVVLMVSLVVMTTCVQTADTPTATPVMETIISTVDTYLIPTSEAFPEPPSTVIPTSIPVPTITSTVTGQWQILPAVSLNCWGESVDSSRWRQWYSVEFSHIEHGGLIADGDILWISTQRAIFRLNVHTLACTAFLKERTGSH